MVIDVFQPRVLFVLILAGLTVGWVNKTPALADEPPVPRPSHDAPVNAPQKTEQSVPATPQGGATGEMKALKVGARQYLVTEGPIVGERQAFYARLLDIGEKYDNGFGITGYMKAFETLEQSVKGGAGEEEVQAELKRLSRGLDDQIKRSRLLKVQKPAPPIAASGPNPSEMEAAKSGGRKKFSGLGAGQQGQLIDTLKDKWFGGEIPESIKSKIPAGFDPSMLNTPEGQSILQKLNSR